MDFPLLNAQCRGDGAVTTVKIVKAGPQAAPRRVRGLDEGLRVFSLFCGRRLSIVTRRAVGGSMKKFALKVRKFLGSEDGPTAVEYAVMLALIVVVCLGAIQTIGTRANTTFTSVGTALQGSSSSS